MKKKWKLLRGVSLVGVLVCYIVIVYLLVQIFSVDNFDHDVKVVQSIGNSVSVE